MHKHVHTLIYYLVQNPHIIVACIAGIPVTHDKSQMKEEGGEKEEGSFPSPPPPNIMVIRYICDLLQNE